MLILARGEKLCNDSSLSFWYASNSAGRAMDVIMVKDFAPVSPFWETTTGPCSKQRVYSFN